MSANIAQILDEMDEDEVIDEPNISDLESKILNLDTSAEVSIRRDEIVTAPNSSSKYITNPETLAAAEKLVINMRWHVLNDVNAAGYDRLLKAERQMAIAACQAAKLSVRFDDEEVTDNKYIDYLSLPRDKMLDVYRMLHQRLAYLTDRNEFLEKANTHQKVVVEKATEGVAAYEDRIKQLEKELAHIKKKSGTPEKSEKLKPKSAPVTPKPAAASAPKSSTPEITVKPKTITAPKDVKAALQAILRKRKC